MKNFSGRVQPFHKEANARARDEEAALLPALQRFFDDPELEQSEGAFAAFDFVSPRHRIELKTRNCFVHTYRDLMINANKIAEARKYSHLYDYIFVFKFVDGSVYYWKFDARVELERRLGGRTDRGINEIREYYFIPNDILDQLPYD
jgi:hypothetical protein